nr:FecR domain-containing protein [Paucibacter sp. KBW04]
MQNLGEEPEPRVTPEIAAEASVWIARLHGPDRSPQMERECRAWQAASAAHRLAFERCTDVWESVPRVSLADAFANALPAKRLGKGPTSGKLFFAALLALGILGTGLSLSFWQQGEEFVTKIGEQHVAVLDDGTRMSLNTNTKVLVEMDSLRRRVSLLGGEAYFEVAKDARRPFVVRVLGSEVEALGTAFSVRLGSRTAGDGAALEVALLEGQLTVRPAGVETPSAMAPSASVLMQAGDRVRLFQAVGKVQAVSTPQLDRPHIEQLIAWRHSEALFEDVSLAEAVMEMNRYSRTPIVLREEGALANLRISGLYKTGDNPGFANSVASLYGLMVREHAGRLELALSQ